MSYQILITLAFITAFVFFLFLTIGGNLVFGFLVWLFAAIFIPSAVFLISTPGFPDIYLERIIFVFLIPPLLFAILSGKERLLPNTALEYWMGILLVILIISMGRTGFLATPGGGFQPFHIFLTGFFFPFSFYYFGKTFIYSKESLRVLLWGLMVFFVYFVITAYLEHFKINALIYPRFVTNPLIGLHYGRARGPFLSAPVNGWIIATLFFSTLLLLLEIENIFVRGLLLLFILATPLAIFYTYTRAVWLSFILAPLVVSVFSKRLLIRRRLVPFLLIFLIVLASVGWENLKSSERAAGGVMEIPEVEARIALYDITKVIFRNAPLFGLGLGRFNDAIPYYAPEFGPAGRDLLASQHNIFLGIVAEVGLIGLVPFLIILYYLIKYSFFLYRILGEEGLISKELVVTFWAILIIYLASASFIQSQYFIAPNSLVFLWGGIIVGSYQRKILQLGE
jgi:O-antigen ligase